MSCRPHFLLLLRVSCLSSNRFSRRSQRQIVFPSRNLRCYDGSRNSNSNDASIVLSVLSRFAVLLMMVRFCGIVFKVHRSPNWANALDFTFTRRPPCLFHRSVVVCLTGSTLTSNHFFKLDEEVNYTDTTEPLGRGPSNTQPFVLDGKVDRPGLATASTPFVFFSLIIKQVT